MIEDDFVIFASRIADLINDPELSTKLGKFGRELVLKNMTGRKNVKKLENLYQAFIT